MNKIVEQQAIEIFYLKYEKALKRIFVELGEPPLDVKIFEAYWAHKVSILATELEVVIGKEKTDELVLQEMKNTFSFSKENNGTMFIKEFGKNELHEI